jgi:hypothetical protein
VTSNNPLAQPNDASETLAPAGAPPPVLPSGAVAVTVGGVPLDPQVLEAQRAAVLEQLVEQQLAAMRATNAQIQQLQVERHAALAADPPDTATAATLQNQIDAMTSQSQLEMIKLQSMVNKQNEAIAQMQEMLSEYSATKDQILRNMS